MPTLPTVSLIISTYNWPKALEMTLISIREQHYMPNEVIIADDGSDEETRELVDDYRPTLKVPLQHVWHEDRGFSIGRNTESRNLSGKLGLYHSN